MRKLKITEMNRLTEEEFKVSRKMTLKVVLDDVRSMHNVGAVFRTADAFRIESIYICGITATPFEREEENGRPQGSPLHNKVNEHKLHSHQEIHKTALGAEFTVDWKHFESVIEAVEELHEEGYKVYAIEQCEGSVMLDKLKIDSNGKYAIILGNEVKGVSQEAIDKCDGSIEIPQYGTKHSLNVSVAAGIAMWELIKALKAVDKYGE